MRLAGQTQLGYYPTPDRVLALLATWLALPRSPVALDPSCGTGAALATLVPAGVRYGVELDHARAADAASRLTVLDGAFEDTEITPGSFGLILLNPPYDHDAATGTRSEATFLTRALPLLAPNGVLVLIVPENQLRDFWGALARFLLVDGLWRFPDPEYDDFGQAVVVGHRVPEHTAQRNRSFMAWCHQTRWTDPPSLPPLAPRLASESAVAVPEGHRPLRYRLAPDRPEMLAAHVALTGGAFAQLKARTVRATAPSADHAVRPPLPLHRGHLATLLAAGVLSGALGTGEQRHLVRGRVVPVDTVETQDSEDALVTITRRSFRVTVTTLAPDGALHEWKSATAVVDPTDEAVDTEEVGA